jgi:hypothetical protein
VRVWELGKFSEYPKTVVYKPLAWGFVPPRDKMTRFGYADSIRNGAILQQLKNQAGFRLLNTQLPSNFYLVLIEIRKKTPDTPNTLILIVGISDN